MAENAAAHERALRLLGLARRAGKLALGNHAVRQAISRGTAKLIIIATDASKRTQRDFAGLARTARIRAAMLTEMEVLGAAVGAAPLGVCAVCDQDFANGIGAVLGLGEF